MFDDEIRDMGRNAVAGLRAVEKGGRLTVEEVFLVQIACAALTYFADIYNKPVDKSAPRPVVIDGTQMLKEAIGANTQQGAAE